MGYDGYKINYHLLQFLKAESQNKWSLEIGSTWSMGSLKSHNIPLQTNYNYCGAFLCQYANCVSLNKKLTFTSKDVAVLRQKIMREILNRTLLEK